MKKKLYIVLYVLLLVLLSSSVLGYFPVSHKYLNNKLMTDFNSDSNLYQICKKHSDLCFVGNILSDISVVYYYTEGFKYEITHAPSFCFTMMENAKNEEETACAIGSCLHATQDMVSHNDMVPYAITRTGIVNSIIHVFAEQELDNYVNGIDPSIKDKAMTNLNSFNTCVPLLKRVLGGYSEYDSDIQSGKLDTIIDKFIAEIQGSVTGYDTSFRTKLGLFDNVGVVPKRILLSYIGLMIFWVILFILILLRKQKTTFNYISLGLLFLIFGLQLSFFIANTFGASFQLFSTVIKPISNLVPIGDEQSRLDKAFENGKAFFTEGETWLINTEASGFTALKKADDSVKWFNYLILGIIVVLLIGFIYVNLLKKKKN